MAFRWLCAALAAWIAAAPCSALEFSLEQFRRRAASADRPIAVLDVDNFLLHTGGRNVQILRDFTVQPDIAANFSEDVRLTRLIVDHSQIPYDLLDALRLVGLRNEIFLRKLRHFQDGAVFDAKYMAKDPPMDGAVEFAQAIVQSRTTLIYLTGLWRGYRRGRVNSLRLHGFPMPDGRSVRLLMKPVHGMDDYTYKRGRKKWIDARGEVILAGDNEPINANNLKADYPNADVIFLETGHSDRLDPATGQIPVPRPDLIRRRNFLGL